MIDLGRQLNFTQEDLAANREGHLTESQRARLRLALLRDTLLYGLFALVPFAILVLLLGTQASSPVVLLILALIVLAFVVYTVTLNRSTRADLAANVNAVSGKVSLYDVGRGLYRLEITPKSFQVSAAVFHAFADGRLYRVYYTPNLKIILSAELAELPSGEVWRIS